MLDIMNWKCLEVHSLSVRMIFINPRKRCEVHVVHPDSVAFLGCYMAPVNSLFPRFRKTSVSNWIVIEIDFIIDIDCTVIMTIGYGV